VRSRRGSPLIAVAVLALLVAGSAACRPRTPTPTTTRPTTPSTAGPTTPSTAGPTTTRTTAPSNIPIQTKKIRYGPFTVPNVNAPGKSSLSWALPFLGVTLEKGMIWNEPKKDQTKPCDDCFITSIEAGLEYTDGSNANIHNGLWLHHMVAMNQGAGRSDATCSSAAFSMPHFAVGATAKNSERFFASGNERTTMNILEQQSGRYGYRVNPADRFHFLVDLMNLNTTDKTVYLTLDYKYVPASTPGFRAARPVWLDAAQCGTSEVAAKTGRYTVTAPTYISNISGTLLGGGGHLHDGGTNAIIEKNGQKVCDSVAKYGTKPEYIEPGGHEDPGGGHGHGGMQHISEHTLCPPGWSIAPGDRLVLKGLYDDAAHPQMVHDGKLHSVMAIAILYFST
jgi:hypothetical protein